MKWSDYMKTRKKKIFYTIGAALILLLAVAYINREAIAMAGFDWFVQDSVEKKLENTYKPVEGREPKPVNVDKTKQEPFSVLLLGVDQREHEVGRSDTLIYAVVRPSDGNILLVSVPRDSYVDIVGRDREDKINHAYAFGGAGMSMDTVEKLLEAPVNHYATINFEGFRDAVDALGGISLPIQKDIINKDPNHDYFIVKAGQPSYNGLDALNFVRYREDSDMNRTERQQQFLHAMIEKATAMKSWSKIPDLLDIMGNNFSTDMRPNQLVDLAQSLLVQKQRTTMHSHTLQGEGRRLKSGGTWYYFLDEKDLSEVRSMIKNWLDGDTPSSSLILPDQEQEAEGIKKEVQSLSSAR
jgi:polyisoprenyl-teichoic acid--peptidoglycan teichoic acid transferase